MLRSEKMGYYKVQVSRGFVWEIVNDMGELGDNVVEFETSKI